MCQSFYVPQGRRVIQLTTEAPNIKVLAQTFSKQRTFQDPCLCLYVIMTVSDMQVNFLCCAIIRPLPRKYGKVNKAPNV